jgi:5-methylcytosine-specific restriction endonuclease McrA
MDYSDYLKSDEWKKLRKQALIRAKHRCQICNDVYKLSVHHRTYYFDNPDIADLTVLCDPCHKHFHNIIEETIDWYSTYPPGVDIIDQHIENYKKKHGIR